MKFISFKEFRPNSMLDPIKDAVSYLYVDLSSTLRDLQKGLTRINFEDNFNSFEYDVVGLGSNKEVKIRNILREEANFVIPSKFLIVRMTTDKNASGFPVIIDGDTAWTKEYVYLKNVGTNLANFTVVFLK